MLIGHGAPYRDGEMVSSRTAERERCGKCLCRFSPRQKSGPGESEENSIEEAREREQHIADYRISKRHALVIERTKASDGNR